MHTAEALRDRYLQGTSGPCEINAIARIYAQLRAIPFDQALMDVHDGLGYELTCSDTEPSKAFPWAEVSRSIVPLGRQWINGL